MKKCEYRIDNKWYSGILIGEQKTGIFRRKKYLVEVEIYNGLTRRIYKEKMLFDRKDVVF